MTEPRRAPGRPPNGAPSHLPETVRTPVEQALARGETPEAIARAQGVSLGMVHAIANHIEWLNRQPDVTVSLRGKSSKPRKTRERTLAPCGTVAAYQRHLRHDEEPCEPCRAAKRARSHKGRGREAS